MAVQINKYGYSLRYFYTKVSERGYVNSDLLLDA